MATAHAVFLSYAREDTVAAEHVARALRAAGVEVWFDQRELRGGDAWDAKIKKQIQTCALFVPFISAQTQARAEGYFRLEWLLAAERTKLMGRSKTFLVPLCIDETKEADADVPEAFLQVQWIRLGGGAASASLVERICRLLGGNTGDAVEFHPAGAGPASEAARPQETRPPARVWLRYAIPLGAAAFAAAVWLLLRPAPQIFSAPNSGSTPALATDGRAAAKSPAQSIAVLPFENLSGDKANEYFSDGISDELLNLIGKLPGLRVAGRTSAFSFKGRQVTDTEIAQRLGVTYLVNGTVQKAGDQVRITARLTNAADGYQLWSDRFTKELKDIFAVQDEIATLIAQALQVKLGTMPRVAQTVDPDAHRLVLEGRYHSSLRTKEGFARAEAAFGQAIARDPEFAPAHAGLAEAWVMRANYATQDGMAENEVVPDLQRARAAARRAIAIDPTLSQAHAVTGYCDFMESRYDEAERQYARALELSPNQSIFYAWRAVLRLGQGRLDDAVKDFEKTVTLDPLWPVSLANSADVLLRARQLDNALLTAERALNLRQGIYLPALGVRVQTLWAMGRVDAAVADARLIRKHLEENPRRGADETAIWVLHQAGYKAEASAYLEEYLQTLPERSQQRGYSLGAVGRFDEALPFMERTPSSVRRRLYWDPIWDPWRDDPRFLRLMAKLGCAEEYRVARATLTRILQVPGARK